MQLTEIIKTVADAYEQLEEEDRISVVHFLHDDYGTWDLSPPLNFQCGTRPSDIKEILQGIAKCAGVDGMVTLNDSWTYPNDISKMLHKLTQEQQQAYYDATPPSEHPQRVNCAMILAATKEGELVFGLQNRGSELIVIHGDEVQNLSGRQVVAIKDILGIA